VAGYRYIGVLPTFWRQLLSLSSGTSCTLYVQAAGTYRPMVPTVANPWEHLWHW